MSRELYDYLVREKIADGALISKWRKPGYEILCSMLAIQKGNHNFGTTSHCRVPLKQRAAQQRITPDVQTGCICCASGDGRFGGPIWCPPHPPPPTPKKKHHRELAVSSARQQSLLGR
jgi:bud site selection protein 31